MTPQAAFDTLSDAVVAIHNRLAVLEHEMQHAREALYALKTNADQQKRIADLQERFMVLQIKAIEQQTRREPWEDSGPGEERAHGDR